MTTWAVRSATDDDQQAMSRLAATGFGVYMAPESKRPWRVMVAEGGSVVVADGPEIVGMACYLDMELTVPGGATLPIAGISAVVVSPTHRRRGILRAMVTDLHRRIGETGAPIAALTASEGGIYGRFGYGPATIERSLVVQRRLAEFHADAPDDGRVRLVAPAQHREQLMEIYDRWRRMTPGGLVCPQVLWDDVLADRDSDRGGASAWFALLHPDGYALYRVRHGDKAVVRATVTAVTPQAHAALWRTLLGLDLIDEVQIDTHPADPLPYLLVDARRAQTTSMVDALWLRIMDIPAALQARTYPADAHLVLEVGDGRFALDISGGRATCVPTDAAADLQLDLDALGSIYLGTHAVRDLAAANRIRGTSQEATALADAAFRSTVPAQMGFHF